MGFRADELMSGRHEFLEGCGPAGSHPVAFRVNWGPDRLRDWLNPRHEAFLWQELEGKVMVGGLCGWTPCTGTLHLDYFGGKRIRYDFDFEVGGRTLRFIGDKQNIRLWNLPVSHTTMAATLTERTSGRLLSTSMLRFKFRHMPSLMLSFRPA